MIAVGRDWEDFTRLSKLIDAVTFNPPAQQIRKICKSVEDCLAANKDNLRTFFELAFPSLLKKVFGYDDYDASWLNIVAKPGMQDDARALLQLLSPAGKLFSAMHSADAERVIQYLFPLERLPAHTQELLKRPAGRKELGRWPQYAGRLQVDPRGAVQIVLNVYEYYIFWTAFYVLRGNRGADAQRGDYSSSSRSRGYTSNLRSMGSSFIHGVLHHHQDGPAQEHPYLELLRGLLRAYLPRQRASLGGAPGGAYGSASALQRSPGEVLLGVLLEFWLTDVGEPLPEEPAKGTTGQATGVATTAPVSHAIRAYSFQPPAEEQVAAIALLTRYIHADDSSSSSPRPGQSTTLGSWVPSTGIYTAPYPPHRLQATQQNQSANQAVQAVSRKVYRLLRRSFAQWPYGSSSMNLTPLLKCWLATMCPWQSQSQSSASSSSNQGYGQQRDGAGMGSPASTLQHTLQSVKSLGDSLQSRLAGSREGTPEPQTRHQQQQQQQQQQAPYNAYSQDWQGHVMSHLPFYLVLLPQFIQLSYSRLSSSKSEAAARDLQLVLASLANSPGLLDLLSKIEGEFRQFVSNTTFPRRAESGEKLKYEAQLPWWYDQLHDWEAAAAAGAPTTPPLQPETTFRLFTTDVSSPAFFARAAVKAAAGAMGSKQDFAERLQKLAERVLPIKQLPDEQQGQQSHGGQAAEEAQAQPDPLGGRSYPKVGRWQEVRYKGDWMRRPIASNEVGLLVRVLVKVSDRVNRTLGLDQRAGQEEEEPETVVQQGMLWARHKQWRVNLRPLAEVQMLGWLGVCVTLAYMVLSACMG